MQMSGHDRVPIKLYLGTLKSEFHVIFTCREMLLFFRIPRPQILFQPFQNVRTLLGSWDVSGQAARVGCSLPIPGLKGKVRR